MANCVTCGAYYKRNQYNSTDHCENCLYDGGAADGDIMEEDEVDFDLILNPTGKTPARFSDE